MKMSKKDVLFMKWFTGFVTSGILVSFLITVFYQMSHPTSDALVDFDYWSFLVVLALNAILYWATKKSKVKNV